VAAFAPITLHGELDSGELVSLLDAQNYGGPGPWNPRYVARAAVVGAHVLGDQAYSAVRFRFDAPRWTAHLADGEAYTVPDDGSLLRAVAPGADTNEGMWLVYEAAKPGSRRVLDSRVLSGCRALARLALDQPVMIQTVEVRLDHEPGGGGSDWLGLHSKGYCSPINNAHHKPLIPQDELTVERFATWIALNDTLDGLTSAAIEPIQGALQAQVLVTTSLFEGLHRRLSGYKQSQFPEASANARKQVKKAARDSAAERAKSVKGMDSELVRETVRSALSHVEDVGYRSRAQDILDEVTSVVPELTESIPDLAGKLVTARNEIAHHLLGDEKEPLADRFDRWVVVSYVTPWLLRLLLLLRAGIDSDILREACLDYQKFEFLRANLATITRDLGWTP
jgi:hypothetical protein